MRIVMHPDRDHAGPDLQAGEPRPTEGSRLLASGRLGAVIVAAAHAAIARRAEQIAREAGVCPTLDRARPDRLPLEPGGAR